MFARFLRKLSQTPRNGTRSRRLEAEGLEGRSVPSAVPALVGSAPGIELPSPPGGSHVREMEPLVGGTVITIIVPSGTVEPNTDGPPPGTGGSNGLLGGGTV